MNRVFTVLIRAFFLLIFIINVNISFGQNENVIDSLENILKKNIPDSTRFNTLVTLGKESFNSGKPGLAYEYAIYAAELEKEKRIKSNGFQNYRIGYIFFKMGLINESLERYLIAIENFKIEKNTKMLFDVYYRIAWIYGVKYDYINQLKTYDEIKEYSKKVGMIDNLARAYIEISTIYQKLNDFTRESEYLKKYFEISKDQDTIYYNDSYHYRMGEIQYFNENYSEAIKEYIEALKYYKDENTSIIIFTHLRIAFMHYLNKDLDKSLIGYEKVLNMSEETGFSSYLINAYGNLGNIFRDKEDYEKADEYYQKAINTGKEINDVYNLWWIYDDIRKMHISKKDYKQAFEYNILYDDIGKEFRDNLLYQERMEGRTKYIEYKNQEDLKEIAQKLKTSRILFYALLILVFLLSVIGFLLFRQSRLRTKQRIAAMSHKISEITQKNLRQQMNPHFIFNTLNSIQYYMFRNDKIATNKYLTKFSSLMRKTLENSEHTSISVKEEIDALELYLQLESVRFKGKFDYIINIDENIDSLVHKVPTLLIQPFVENSICHGINHMDGKGHIVVDLTLDGDVINCVIEDNGVGRKKAMEIKNKNGESHSSFGTNITENRLKLVSSLYSKDLQLSYIDLYDEKGIPSGTRVEILIPIIQQHS